MFSKIEKGVFPEDIKMSFIELVESRKVEGPMFKGSLEVAGLGV